MYYRAGYYSISTGNTGPAPALCIKDHYCAQGTGQPTPCPNGEIAPWTGSRASTDCVPCTRGNYCNLFAYYTANNYTAVNAASYFTTAYGNPAYYGTCKAGYICLEGSTVSAPTDNVQGYICPIGYYCPLGAIIEEKCPVGTYNNLTGQGACTQCPAGTYCNLEGMTIYQVCTQGNYCPAGSIRAIPCEAGTLSNGTGL